MTGQDLIDFIEVYGLQDWQIKAKVHGSVVEIQDAVRTEGEIWLYPSEDEE